MVTGLNSFIWLLIKEIDSGWRDAIKLWYMMNSEFDQNPLKYLSAQWKSMKNSCQVSREHDHHIYKSVKYMKPSTNYVYT